MGALTRSAGAPRGRVVGGRVQGASREDAIGGRHRFPAEELLSADAGGIGSAQAGDRAARGGAEQVVARGQGDGDLEGLDGALAERAGLVLEGVAVDLKELGVGPQLRGRGRLLEGRRELDPHLADARGGRDLVHGRAHSPPTRARRYDGAMRNPVILTALSLLALGSSNAGCGASPSPATCPEGTLDAEPRGPAAAHESGPAAADATIAPPADRYMYAKTTPPLDEGEPAVTTVVLRIGSLGEAVFPGEPRIAWLADGPRVFEQGADFEEPEDDSAPDPLEAAAQELCARGDAGMPWGLRADSAIDVLGPAGWTPSRVARCTAWEDGHSRYLGLVLAEPVDGALLAAPHREGRTGSLRVVREPLPGPRPGALTALRADLGRMGVGDPLLSAPAEAFGLVEVGGATVVHAGLPFGWPESADDEGEEEGQEEGETLRSVCGEEGLCAHTAILLASHGGQVPRLLVASAAGAPPPPVLTSLREGEWQLRAVFEDGGVPGLVAGYHDVGHEEVAVMRWSRRGLVVRQTVYYTMGG